MEVRNEFERRRMPTDDPKWFEAHLTLALGELTSVLIWTSVHPGSGHAEQACVVWPHEGKPVAMIEAEIPIPADRWEFRTSGLWVEQVCEKPNEHWSFGLEAFALELDDPTELVRTGYGIRVPLGWELDFVAGEPARWQVTRSQDLTTAGAYRQRGQVSGLLLDGDGERPFEGPAQRWHWWGTEPLSGAGIRRGVEVSPGELHLPLSQGLVVLRSSPTTLTIQASPALAGHP